MNRTRDQSNSSRALERLRLLLREHRDDVEWQFPSERELAEDFAIGRRAVRRAMEVLEAEGLIWRRQGKGTFIGSHPVRTGNFLEEIAGRTNPMEIIEVRLHLEPALAKLAALKASREDIEAIERLAGKTAAAIDDDGWELWDSAFHRRIAEAGGNRMLLSFMDVLQRVRKEPGWRSIRSLARSPDRRRQIFAEHDEIVAAIAARDGAGAERAMRRHVSTVGDNLRSILSGEGSTDAPPAEAASRMAEKRSAMEIE